jgi:hypothetical protein
MKKRTRLLLVVPLVSVLVAVAPFAQAEEPRREMYPREGHVDFHGQDFRHFNEHEHAIWRGGRWHHEWHGGRFGWWWEVAGVWYVYDAPIYPYPTSVPTVVVQPAPAPPAQVQREVVYPYGKYVLYGDGVTRPWQWVWVPAAPAPQPPVPPPPPAGVPPPAPPPPPPPAGAPPPPPPPPAVTQ